MSKSLTLQEFIKKAQQVHKNEDGTSKYDYSKVEYKNSKTKICIICPEHGEFWQKPYNHLVGYGCKKCANKIAGTYHKTSQEEFIKEAQEIHKNEDGTSKYDYSKVEYKNAKTKVCIICPIHGEFWQKPEKHLKKQGCPECSKISRGLKKRISKDDFIKMANERHNFKYKYENYKKISEKVTIICPIHGKFEQLASAHLQGNGCPKCSIERRATNNRYNTEEFIRNAKEKHGDKYDYSKVEYRGCDKPVCIICPIHGEFWQKPSSHLVGSGCQKCNLGVKSNTKEFIEKAKKIHGNFYTYDEVDYKNNTVKIKIKCNICGNEFWQSPSKHLNGCGCPKCKISHLEEIIYQFLEKNDIDFIWQCNSQTFKWLGKLKLDFYLTKYNIAIECQGSQHFIPFKRFGGEESLKKQQERDKRKFELCNENNVKLLYYSNNKYGTDYIITKLDELLNIINNSK